MLTGVGNVYRAEVLFRHGISPTRPGKQVSHEEWQAIWTDLVALMKVGVKRGVMVVVRPEDDYGAPSYSPDRPRTYVYRRAGDPLPLVHHHGPALGDGRPKPLLVPHLPTQLIARPVMRRSGDFGTTVTGYPPRCPAE